MSGPSPLVVFTDLDGSLLDHHSYSFDPALPALDRLRENGVPVVPTTSKTRSEIESLREELGNRHPFIVENGAAIFIPAGYFEMQPAGTVEKDGYWVHELSAPRSQWLVVLQALEEQFPGEYDYFFRVGPSGIVAMTGLSGQAAVRANQREYSEPVKWLGDEKRRTEFVAELVRAGGHALQGGRFLTVAGDCDKGRALAWLRETYREAYGLEKIHDLAIGDSGNDVAMLEAAETALIIRSPVNDFPQLIRKQGAIYSEEFGPAGWAEGVERWLAQLNNLENRI